MNLYLRYFDRERRAGSSPVLGTLFIQRFVGEVAELVDALL